MSKVKFIQSSYKCFCCSDGFLDTLNSSLFMDSQRKFILEGKKMGSEIEFWDEIQRVLCPNIKEFGRNWNAFSEILNGGLGKFKNKQPIRIQIRDRKMAQKNLGKIYKRMVKIIKHYPYISLELF